MPLKIFLLFFLIVLGACAKKTEKLVESQSTYCQGNKLKNQYIVHWKSSYAQLLEIKNLSQWLETNQDFIHFVEPNYLVPIQSDTSLSVTDNSVIRQIIDLPFAWENGFYGQGMTIGIVDTGVDTHHRNLQSKIALNSGELRFGANNIDDDNNGYIDDIYGWNATDNTKRPFDEVGHGTAMAGIITGPFQSETSLSIAPMSKIIPSDFMIESHGTEFHAKEALSYVVARKVNIVNNSWSINCSELLKETFLGWQSENIIFVNAAGNTPQNVTSLGTIPASLDLANHIHVGSSDIFGNRSAFSGFGSTVKILAPGESINSLGANTDDISSHLTGTSASTAIVSAAAAILWQAYPHLKASEVILLLYHGSSTSPAGERILNIKGSLLVGQYLFRSENL